MKHLLLTAVGVLNALTLQAQVPSATAIKDARVVTVSGADLPNATVLVRDGLIQDVGPNLAIPADAWVIDGRGLTVYPGFIDGLSTWGIPAPAPGPTTPQTPAQSQAIPHSNGPEDRPQTYSFEHAADLVSPSDRRLEAARAAGFTTAATFPNRGIVEGLGAIVNLAGQRGRDMVVAEPIGQQIVFRTGGFLSGFPNSLMGNIAYIRQLYLDLDRYKQAQQIYAAHVRGTRRPEYDHDLAGLAESGRVLLPAMEAQQIDRMLNFGRELKTPFIVYGLHEAYKRIDELKQANAPVLVSLKWPVKPKDQDPTDIPDHRELVMRDQAPSVPGMLAKAQVKFGFYSDGVDTAPDLKKAVKKALDSGLSRADAIRALTLNVAEIYGVSDRLGSIEKGKIANVVVTKGDAFEDKASIEYVFIDGTEFKPTKEAQQGPEKKAATAGSQERDGGSN